MFKLVSNYSPNGDQPQAIEKLVEGINEGKKEQILLGAEKHLPLLMLSIPLINRL